MLFCALLTGYASRIASERPQERRKYPFSAFSFLPLLSEAVVVPRVFNRVVMPVIRGCFRGVLGAFRRCSWGVPGVFGGFSEGFRTDLLILLNHGALAS